MQKDLMLKNFEDLKKAVSLLSGSVNRYVPYEPQKEYSQEELDYYDSLSFRFEKTIEVILNFFKGLELFLYSKQSDTLRDRLLAMQKIEVIDGIDFWIEARLLRNKISHPYLPEQLQEMYQEIVKKAKVIEMTVSNLEDYISKL